MPKPIDLFHVLVAGALSLFMLFLPHPAAAQNPLSATVAVNASLRAGPGRAYRILGSIRAGTTVAAEARTTDSIWLVIDPKGWVMARQLMISQSADLRSLPVSDTVFGDSAATSSSDSQPPEPAKAQPSVSVPERNFDPLLYTAKFSPPIRKAMRAVFEKGNKL